VPVVAARSGALPEIVGEEACVPRGDALAMATRMSELWDDAGARVDQGGRAIARARDSFGEERYIRSLLALYAGLGAQPAGSA
jgi:glycosyltransferase involved in cell wall biosynthesis